MNSSELSRAARALYREGSRPKRALQLLRPQICPFEQILPWIPSRARVLDVGCGGGLFLLLLATFDQTADCIGIDVSASSIRFAQENLRRVPTLAQRVGFQVFDATQPWPFGRFDVVSLIDVLHHVPQDLQMELLNEAASHVKPGGLLVYKDMCDSPWWLASANRLHDVLLARQWIHYLPIEAVERWAISNGMKLLHTEHLRRYWYGHEFRVFSMPTEAENEKNYAQVAELRAKNVEAKSV